MNILICGRGKGSWLMRGVQVGAALGARVRTDPTEADIRWADVVILLKKYALDYAARVHRAGKPIVWDALDFWSQPAQNRLSVTEGLKVFHQLKWNIKPQAVVCATQQMADDCGGFYIPHHCRLGLRPIPPRDSVRVVAYDGSERYLGAWDVAIREECHRRGWFFEINPRDLSQVDILVAFRDGPWDGPICRTWKSGIKYVNALSAGRPIISQPSAARDELDPAGASIETMADLSYALDECARDRLRQLAFEHAMVGHFSVHSIVETFYRPLLSRIVTEAPCLA